MKHKGLDIEKIFAFQISINRKNFQKNP